MTKEEFERHLLLEKEYLEIDIHGETYLCEKCASANIDQQNWVGVNTGYINELIDPEVWYCNECEMETEGLTVDDFREDEMYLNIEFQLK